MNEIFTKKVSQMRKFQKQYFEASRINHPSKSGILKDAKMAEKEVDEMLDGFERKVGSVQGQVNF